MKRYEKYKPSGIPWIGEIPEHWVIKKLKWSLQLSRGFDLPSHEFVRGNYPVYGSNGIIGYHEEYKAKGPGITIGRSGSVGAVNYVESDFWPHNTCLYVERNFDNDWRYVFYYLQCMNLKSLSSGTAVGTLNRNYIHDEFVGFPSEDEQVSIAEYLNYRTTQIDELIAKKQQLIDLLNEEKAAIIKHAVTKGLNPDAPMKESGIPWLGEVPGHWEVNRLKYIARVFRGKFSHRPRNDGRLYNGQFPFIQTGEVARATKYLNEFSQTLNEEGRKVTTEFPAGTLLMTIAANVGEVAILGIDACFPDSIVGFYPRPFLDNEFLFYKLKSLKEEFIRASIINTQLNLNIDRISAISISFPSKDEQTQIVQHIEAEMQKTDSTIAKIEKEILLLQEYREALISEAVTGKIDVRGAC